MLSTELIKQKIALYSHVEQSDMRELCCQTGGPKSLKLSL